MSDITATVAGSSISVAVASGGVAASVSGSPITVGVTGSTGPQGPQGPAGASAWSDVTGKPDTFPPSTHTHALSSLTQSSASNGQAITWNGTAWVATTLTSYSLPVATSSVLGGVKAGSNVTVGVDGTISVAAPFSGSYSDLSNKPSLDFAASSHTHPLSSLTQSSATTGQVAQWDGTAWVAATVSGGGGDFLPLAGGTMAGNIVFDATGGQYIGKGLVDTGRSGSYGISLVCSVNYQFNWQAGWILATEQDGTTPRPLYLDSAAGTTLRVWDEGENEGVEVAHDGITLPNGVAIEPIAGATGGGLRFNVGNSSLSYEANDYLACRSTGGGLNAIVCLSPVEFQPNPGVEVPMKIDPNGLRFPDGTTQTTAPSSDYDDLTNKPTLGSAAAASTSDFAAATHSHSWSDITTGVPSTFTPPIATSSVLGGVKQGSNVTIGVDGAISVAAPFSGSYSDLTNKPSLGTAAAAASTDFASATHSHGISDVTGLQTALDGKQASGSYAASSHTHSLSDLSQSGATTNQVAQWNGSAWVAATVSGGGGSSSASDLTSGSLNDARLSDKAQSAMNLYLWSNFR